MPKLYYVYVIALKSEFLSTVKARKANPGYRPGKRCYYVGYTTKTPERRYVQHMAGGQSRKGINIYSKVVYKYGVYPNGLRPDLYESYNPIHSQKEAIKLEETLARKLRDQGHCVWQN